MFSTLSGNQQSTPLPDHSSIKELAEQFSQYFISKIETIRLKLDATVNSSTFNHLEMSTSSKFSTFHCVSEDELGNIIAKSPLKTCPLDPIPTSLLKQCMEKLLTIITVIINLSLQHGIIPESLKTAIVTPILKKTSLDTNQLKNYRPVSNLPFLSKVLEKVVAVQLNKYLSSNGLLEPCQSAYRQYHSTETALVKVNNDICMALDSGKCVLLALLDLSAAFDTIDHDILISRLSKLGITDIPLNWFSSYLKDRYQSVSIQGTLSKSQPLQFGVPQGSVLGPLLFCLYISPLGSLIRNHNLDFQQYADDNQLYHTFSLSDSSSATIRMEAAALDIKNWMTKNKLQLNDGKTEVLFIRSQFNRIPLSIDHLKIGTCDVQLAKSARDIGVTLDDQYNLRKHISLTCKSIYFHLRTIGRVRHYLTKEVCQQLVHAIVSSKLDYCNSLLYGLPEKDIIPLQLAQNTAARIVTRTKKTDHITPVLASLHWLPVRYRIQYKLLLITYKALNDTAPSYIVDLIHSKPTTRTLRSNNKCLLHVPRCYTKSYGERAFSRAAPLLWNSIPFHLRSLPTVEQFKKGIKTYLFSRAF